MDEREPITQLLSELEALVGTDAFEYELPGKTAELESAGAGIETVTPILQLMERHPLEDFGVPGALVHFVERYYRRGYEPLLAASLRRRPARHTLWMLSRIINGSEEKGAYLQLMADIAADPRWKPELRARAQEYWDYQTAYSKPQK